MTGTYPASRNGREPSRLRAALEGAGGSLKSLTVLAPQNDPFRVDTPAGHRDAQWLADILAALPKRQWWTHGLHYALTGEATKPNGQPYTNTSKDETWLEHAAKAARWLGYIPFEAIRDKRNAEPIVIEWEPPTDPKPDVSEPWASLTVDYFLPDADHLAPSPYVTGFKAAQPYHLAFVGEKDSLAGALGSVAQRRQADQYWVNGEITDTRAHQMAAAATRTGRPLIVLYFSDCNPAGHQMPISLARKLQGFKAIESSELQLRSIRSR